MRSFLYVLRPNVTGKIQLLLAHHEASLALPFAYGIYPTINSNSMDKASASGTGTSKNYETPMFPSPTTSTDQIHLGHFRVFAHSDVLTRYYALLGHRVTHPFGSGVFELPPESKEQKGRARFFSIGAVKVPTYKLPGGEYVSETEVDGDKGTPNPFKAMFTHRPTGQRVTAQSEDIEKSKKNEVGMSEVVDKFGADLVRMTLMFETRPSLPIEWPYPCAPFRMRTVQRSVSRLEVLVDEYVEGRKNGENAEVTDKEEMEEAVRACSGKLNHFSKKMRVSLQILPCQNLALTHWFDFIKGMKELTRDVPALSSRSVEFERSLHAIVVMGQIFAPNLAETLWKKLSEAPKLSSQLQWTPETPVNEQKWPEIDPHGGTELYLCTHGTLNHIIVPTEEVAELSDQQLEDYFRQKSHRRFFELFDQRKFQIADTFVERIPGLCIVLHLDVANNISKGKITAILNQLSNERKKKKKEAKHKGSEDMDADE